jgi:hypothetical protein
VEDAWKRIKKTNQGKSDLLQLTDDVDESDLESNKSPKKREKSWQLTIPKK